MDDFNYDPSMDDVQPEQTGMPVWAWVLIGVCGAVEMCIRDRVGNGRQVHDLLRVALGQHGKAGLTNGHKMCIRDRVPTYEGCAELWDTLTAGAGSTAAE